jgi:hypothetical protein
LKNDTQLFFSFVGVKSGERERNSCLGYRWVADEAYPIHWATHPRVLKPDFQSQSLAMTGHATFFQLMLTLTVRSFENKVHQI